MIYSSVQRYIPCQRESVDELKIIYTRSIQLGDTHQSYVLYFVYSSFLSVYVSKSTTNKQTNKQTLTT